MLLRIKASELEPGAIMRVQLRGVMADGSAVAESVDWPSYINADRDMTVRFERFGEAYEGEIQGVIIDTTPNSPGVPTLTLREVRKA